MDLLFSILLIIHIVGGTIGLIVGIFAMILRKGDGRHMKIGKVFFVAMMAAGISSLILSVIKSGYFLFIVGIFTIYLVGSGQYYILKHRGSRNKLLEKAIVVVMYIIGGVFLVFGSWLLLQSIFIGLVLLIFGFIVLLFVRQDLKNFREEVEVKNFALIAHLQRMTGGFIAALTAFLVVNSKYIPAFLPGFLFWIIPTIIFTPLINKWSKRYSVRINS